MLVGLSEVKAAIPGILVLGKPFSSVLKDPELHTAHA